MLRWRQQVPGSRRGTGPPWTSGAAPATAFHGSDVLLVEPTRGKDMFTPDLNIFGGIRGSRRSTGGLGPSSRLTSPQRYHRTGDRGSGALRSPARGQDWLAPQRA